MPDERKMTAVGVLFDMDGVLVDSAHLHLRAYRRVFQDCRYDFPEVAREAVLEGKPRRQVLDLAAPMAGDELKKRLFDAKPEALKQVLAETGDCGMPGARETVEALSMAGVPMAVVTNSRTPEVWLEKLGIAHRIRVLITGSDVGAAKPSPAGFLLGAERLGVEPSACVAVEDSQDGWLAATEAGMKVALFALERPPWLGEDAWLMPHLDAEEIQRRLKSIR